MYDIVVLRARCPHCRKSLLDSRKLIDGDVSIKLAIKNKKEQGFLWLSSTYGNQDFECSLALPDGTEPEVSCPHCAKMLNSTRVCHDCGSPIITLKLEDGNSVSFCGKIGCKRHFVEYDNLAMAMKKLMRDQVYSDYIMEEDTYTDTELYY